MTEKLQPSVRDKIDVIIGLLTAHLILPKQPRNTPPKLNTPVSLGSKSNDG